ncbi:ObirGr8 [Ooceraea biroi]|uniref:Gustatory receptor n=1 Tax=Ooceraea biroi TaxID=2015173 RepID=A0A026W510_OOCBI|nr:uncharacterized protein LOC105283082 [Ooceraea biroi]EZA51160.1 hypothetical protein X777_10285 [Ooceraea biroi]RLU22278.1 ObirGr8 [Ooceraea biroi]
MKKTTTRTPFQNLRFLIFLNKVLALISCRLMNGRFKRSNAWSHYYCALWFLLHCAYSSVYYYTSCTALPTKKAEKGFVLSIVRFSAYFVSLLPYHAVAILYEQDFIKLSDKLETYDDKATELGHPRKDHHVFIWLYFLYTFTTISIKAYYAISGSLEGGTSAIVVTLFEFVVPIVIGTYSVFLTGIFLDLIRQRFRHLNEAIVPRVSQLPITGLRGVITLYDVRYLHSVLLDSAKLIDMLYGIGTLIVFGSILLEFVSVIYMFITGVQDNAMVTMMDLLFQVIYLFAMYHFTTYEANRVEEGVARYGLSFQNAKSRLDKIEMMLYFYHKRFSFTAAEFFILDLTILVSIASTVATYMTLII